MTLRKIRDPSFFPGYLGAWLKKLHKHPKLSSPERDAMLGLLKAPFGGCLKVDDVITRAQG